MEHLNQLIGKTEKKGVCSPSFTWNYVPNTFSLTLSRLLRSVHIAFAMALSVDEGACCTWVVLHSALCVQQSCLVHVCQTDPHGAWHCHQEHLPWVSPLVSGALVLGGNTLMQWKYHKFCYGSFSHVYKFLLSN